MIFKDFCIVLFTLRIKLHCLSLAAILFYNNNKSLCIIISLMTGGY